MPDPNNPLSYIGASNDPTLGDRVKQSQKSTLDLQRGLGQIAAQGQNERQLAGINNLAQAKRVGMQYGLNPNSPTFAADLAQRRGDIHDTSRSNILSNQATAAGIGASKLGFLPHKPQTLSQAVDPFRRGTSGLPIDVLTSKVAGLDAAVQTKRREDTVKKERHRTKFGEQVGGIKETTTGKDIQETKTKGSPTGLTSVEKDTLMREIQMNPTLDALGITDIYRDKNGVLVGVTANGEFDLNRR